MLSRFLFLGVVGGAAFLWLKLSNKDGGGGDGGGGDGDGALAGMHLSCMHDATILQTVQQKAMSASVFLCTLESEIFPRQNDDTICASRCQADHGQIQMSN